MQKRTILKDAKEEVKDKKEEKFEDDQEDQPNLLENNNENDILWFEVPEYINLPDSSNEPLFHNAPLTQIESFLLLFLRYLNRFYYLVDGLVSF